MGRFGLLRELRVESTGSRIGVGLTGGTIFLGGLLLFLSSQSQVLLSENARIVGITPGLATRDDGVVFVSALLMGLGLSLSLIGLSPLPLPQRLLPATLFMGTSAILFSAHFTVFVNAFILHDQAAARITASFLFHDAMNAQPVATFLLAFVTLVLVLGCLLAALALVAPSVWRHQLLQPQTFEGHRTRLVLVALLIVGSGVTFVERFLHHALRGDGRPTGGVIDPNIAIVYYLLAFATLAALGVLTLRTIVLAWGEPRRARSHNYRAGHHALVWSENGVWALILVLTGVVLLAGPAMRPEAGVDRVFAVDSKGVSVFFLVLVGLYAVHRRLGSGQLRFLDHQNAPPGRRFDHLALLAVAVVAVWVLLALATWQTTIPPASKLAIRMAALALVLFPFALCWTGSGRGRPRPRGAGAAPILLAAIALSLVAGIMLWGVGNSATFQYTQGGGFVWAEGGPLQSVAAVVRVVAAFFLAVPVMLGLWVYAGRTGSVAAAPLAVVAFAILIGTNLAVAIGAAAPYDALTGQTEVVVGMSHVALSATEQAVLLPLRLATAAVGLAAAVLLLRQGVRAEPPVARPETIAATRATAARSRAVPG